MKINKTQLRKVIRESIKNVLKESDTLSYDQELQPGWYVCIEGNYGDVSVWVTDDLNEVREVLDSSESNIIGPYNTEMEANEIADQETEKYGETNGFYRSGNKLTESQLRKIIKESVKNVLKERSLDDIEHTDLYGYNDIEDYSDEELVKVAKSGDYTTAFIDYLKELIGPSAENLTLNSFIKDMRSGKIRYCEKNDGIYYINDWSGV